MLLRCIWISSNKINYNNVEDKIMYTFSGENQTTIYKEALEKLYSDGKEL